MKQTGTWTRLNRLRRRFGFDRNELRRDVDNTQWFTGLLLLVLFLGIAPIASARIAQETYRSGLQTERHEAATHHRVDATITQIQARHRGREITVAWNEPDGVHRTGSYLSYRMVAVGEHPAVWATSSGLSDQAPRTRTRTMADAVGIGLGMLLAMGLPMLLVYGLVRRRCDRRRTQLWDAGWASFDTRRIGP